MVVVATPPQSHFDIAKAVLRAGHNVLLEKPTTISARETRSLLESARRRGLFVLTHFSRRWDLDFLAVKQALSSHDLGRIHEIESSVSDGYAFCESYPGRKPWKLRYPGGGLLLDWAPHLFDQLFELMEPRRPSFLYCDSARPNRLVDFRLEEQFTIHARYAESLVVLRASWNSGLPRWRWLVQGTKGALRVERLGEAKGSIWWRDGDQILTDSIEVPPDTSAVESFRALVQRAFQDPEIRLSEARRMTSVAYGVDLARKSASGRVLLFWKRR